MAESTSFTELKSGIKSSVTEHTGYSLFDGIFFNTFTVLTIVFTTAVTIMPADYLTTIKILSGCAAVMISIDKTTKLGARWIYHREMRQEYRLILEKITLYEIMPPSFTEDERKILFNGIFEDLMKIRRKEISVPGVIANKLGE